MEMINVMDVNLVLIVVGAALAFGWGFVYFSERVAGTAFMEINGTKTDAPMMVPMALEALYLLLLSWLVAVFLCCKWITAWCAALVRYFPQL